MLPSNKRLIPHLAVDVEPVLDSRAWVCLLWDEVLATTLSSSSVFTNPMVNQMYMELSESQRKRAADTTFDVFTYQSRNVGFGPLSPDLCDSS